MVEKDTKSEAKDQIDTRAGAIKEHLANPDWKSNKSENVVGDLTKSKSDVKADRASEGWKNAGIDAYESAKESVSEAATNAKEWITGENQKK